MTRRATFADLLESSGVHPARVARVCRVHLSTVYAWKNGRAPKAWKHAKIAAALGLDEAEVAAAFKRKSA